MPKPKNAFQSPGTQSLGLKSAVVTAMSLSSALCSLVQRLAQPLPIAATISAELPTQPKMPPCALIILRPMSWNSGK